MLPNEWLISFHLYSANPQEASSGLQEGSRMNGKLLEWAIKTWQQQYVLTRRRLEWAFVYYLTVGYYILPSNYFLNNLWFYAFHVSSHPGMQDNVHCTSSYHRWPVFFISLISHFSLAVCILYISYFEYFFWYFYFLTFIFDVYIWISFLLFLILFFIHYCPKFFIELHWIFLPCWVFHNNYNFSFLNHCLMLHLCIILIIILTCKYKNLIHYTTYCLYVKIADILVNIFM